MNLHKRLALPWCLWVLVGLLLLSLVLPRSAVAQGGTLACVSGYALWANSGSRPETLVISGSESVVAGSVRSNADLRLTGSKNRLQGAVAYATIFRDEGDENVYAAPAQQAPSAPPLSYSIADYQPGGAAAVAAAAAGKYTVVNGDLDVSDTQVLSGLYYVSGDAKLSASEISGSFTIVARGTIDMSGSKQNASPYAGGLLFFANEQAPGDPVIKLAGGDSRLRGVIYGPGGLVELSGSSNIIEGAILGNTLSLNGSKLQISFDAAYCPVAPTPTPSPTPGPSPSPTPGPSPSPTPGPSPSPTPAPGDGYSADEVVVKLFDAADLGAIAAANGLNPVSAEQFGTRPIFLLEITDGSDPLTKAGQLLGDERVEYAEPNYIGETPETRRGRGSWVIGGDDGEFTGQWAPATIRLPEAHSITRGAGVTVAVLDTGIDLGHPAFAGRLVEGADFVDGGPPQEQQGTADGGYGHGTHVAGLVLLSAPEANIMPVRVLDANGRGNIWVLAEGLAFAAEIGPDGVPFSGDEADVINLSLGTLRQTDLLEDLVTEFTCGGEDDDDDTPFCEASNGVVVIAAAGNGGDTIPQYPAAEAVPGSLALAASTEDDTLADFSTRGPWVQLAAPGEGILSTVPGGVYGSWSGTSMAAPLTAGAAALLRAAEPGLDAVEVAERLIERAAPMCGPVSLRLDAAAALGLARAGSPDCSAVTTFQAFLPMLKVPG